MKISEILNLNEAVVKPWRKRTLLDRNDSYTKEEVDKVVDTLIKYCPGFLPALKNGGILYRGNRNTTKFTYIDSSTGVRTSRDTNNFYQLMMAASEPLKTAKIPDRSKSLICSTTAHHAELYGKVSVVFPTGKASKIAISSTSDMLESPIRYTGLIIPSNIHLSQFSGFLARFMMSIRAHNRQSFGEFDGYLKMLDINSYEQELSKTPIDIIIGSASNATNGYFGQMQQKITISFKKDFEPFVQKHHKNLLTALANEVLTPETLKLATAIFGEQLPANRECWFSGKAFLVPLDMFAKVVDEVKVRGYEVSNQVET